MFDVFVVFVFVVSLCGSSVLVLLFSFDVENMNECLMCLLCLWFCFASGVAFVCVLCLL